jgi:predicted nucleotidyltransferase
MSRPWLSLAQSYERARAREHFRDYFDLKDELERILGREVDLVDASAVRNPYFKASAFGTGQDLYAA